MRIHFLLIIFVSVFHPVLGQDRSLPNFVIIFNDDQGYQDLGCYGSPNIDTPNIDRLASEGMRFTDFYSAYCVCSASRASLLTGCYQPRINMKGVIAPNSKVGLHPDEITIADLLKTKGYATAMVGKWHVGDSSRTLPTKQGFDTYFGIPYSNDMVRRKGWGNNTPDLDKIWTLKKWDIYEVELYRDLKPIESPVDQTTLTKRYTEEAVRFIHQAKEAPFFLYLAHSMPHVPLFVPDELYDSDPKRAYERVIEHIDWSTGQIMDVLESLGLSQNTFIAYTSDNGPWLSKDHHGGSAKPLRNGKGSTYEGGMRVPGIIRWPERILPGQVCQQVAGTIDFLPTFAAITGAELPPDRPVDGFDLSPLLENPSTPSPHDSVGFYYYRNNVPEAIRMGDWKLREIKKGEPELYQLRNDIGETTNLATTYPEKVAAMRKVRDAFDADIKANARPAWNAVAPTGAFKTARTLSVSAVVRAMHPRRTLRAGAQSIPTAIEKQRAKSQP